MTVVSRMSSIVILSLCYLFFFFFFNDTATTEIYTLSLHDALPIWGKPVRNDAGRTWKLRRFTNRSEEHMSELQLHSFISYAVFCLKKKKRKLHPRRARLRPRTLFACSLSVAR